MPIDNRFGRLGPCVPHTSANDADMADLYESATEDELIAADVEKNRKKAAGTWLSHNVAQIIEAEQREARALGFLR